jgi:hypothetical protein
MPDDKTINDLTVLALKRSERLISILTTFLQEASVLVLVFGILDMYVGNKLTVRAGLIVGTLGFALLVAAFAVNSIFYRVLRLWVAHLLSLQEASMKGPQ